MKKTILLVAALVALGTLAAGATAGTEAGAKKGPKAGQNRLLQGTWLSRVTLENPPPGADATFLALNTFIAGGRLLVSSSQSLPASRSLAHGEWRHTGANRYASTFVAFRFDPAGKFAGTLRVRRELELVGRDTFESADVVEFVAPDGTVVATLRATEVATRVSA